MEISSYLTSQAYLVVISNFHIHFLNTNFAIDKVLNWTHNIKIKATLLKYEVSFRFCLGYE